MMDTPQEKSPRLFAALPVPGAARGPLQALPRKGLEGQWTPPGDLHITLRYLGPVSQESVPAITQALAKVRRPPFSVEVRGFGIFGEGSRPVLWAAVQSTRKVTALAGDINEALAPLGFEMPNKPFTPHITLARLKQEKGLKSYIRQHEGKVAIQWQATAFGLYLSGAPDENSQRYRLLAEFSLFP